MKSDNPGNANFPYSQPDFLLAEIAVKDGTPNDHRIWIYHRPSLSLMEFICLNFIDSFDFKGVQKDYIYMGPDDGDPEAWKGVFVQNNCDVSGHSEEDVLDHAWDYLLNYLKWEDSKN